MTATRSIVAGLVAVLALGSCGGGGVSAPTPVPTAPAAASAQQRTPIGTASLIIRLPTTYYVAKRGSSSLTRKPAFVDPTSGTLLDIYVNGTEALNLDGVTTSDSVTINAQNKSLSGTYPVANVPLYSTTNDIAVIQWDSAHTSIQAVGEALNQAAVAGGSASITMTMQMNATGAAITTMSDGSLAYQVGVGAITACTIYLAGGAQFFVYPIDPLGVLAVSSNQGLGGSPAPSGFGGVPSDLTINTYSSSGDASGLVKTQLGVNALHFVSPSDTVYLSVAFTNPAGVVFSDSLNYPFLYSLATGSPATFSSITSSYVSTGYDPYGGGC